MKRKASRSRRSALVAVCALVLGVCVAITAPASADTSATVVIDPISSGTQHPWLGHGVEVQAENYFCDNPACSPLSRAHPT